MERTNKITLKLTREQNKLLVAVVEQASIILPNSRRCYGSPKVEQLALTIEAALKGKS